MKKIFPLILFLSCGLMAQTPVTKTIPVRAGQKIKMNFDYPELIKVSTWDKSEISIQGTVSINNGENDDAFELETSTLGNLVEVRNNIRNRKDLPHVITLIRDGQKLMFRSKEDYEKYKDQNGGDYNVKSWGVDMDIILDIKLPKNVDTFIESVYGMVEVRAFTGPLTIESKYGGVDAALNEKMVGELLAETNYGQIYSNLDVKLGGDAYSQRDFHTVVSAKLGSGPRYDFESKYGNVYLRKEN